MQSKNNLSRLFLTILIGFLLTGARCQASPPAAPAGGHSLAAAAAAPALVPDFGRLPLSFIPNAGQTEPAVRFQAHSLGGALFFTPGEVVLSLPAPTSPEAAEATVPPPEHTQNLAAEAPNS